MAGRLWLDLTGVAMGSDAAVLVQRIAPHWRAHLGDRLVLCRRSPGLTPLGWDALQDPPHVARPDASTGRLGEWLHGLVARLPVRTRAGLRRAAGLQMQALRTLRPQRPARRAPMAGDTAIPDAGDTLLHLLPFGDLSRFHSRGVHLVLVEADLRPAQRPEWLTPSEAEEAALWRHSTESLLARRVELRDVASTGHVASASAGRPLPEIGFILADGPIGVPGKTPELLLAWRCLRDSGLTHPHLVLAGPVGTLAGDVLTELRNSADFEGTVICWPNPTEGERAALRAACAFSLALEPHSPWGRATWDSLTAAVPCLSAFAAPGATQIDPDNATALAGALRAWIATPPRRPTPEALCWDDVPATLLRSVLP